jgi:hypothetical protein
MMGPMIALALLLAMLAPEDDVVDRVARCGVDRARISVESEGSTGFYVAISSPNSALSRKQLACLYDILSIREGPYFFVFADPAVAKRFDHLSLTKNFEILRDEAREWLASRGLLDRLPAFDPERQTLGEFAGSLERMCDVAPGSRLKIEPGNRLTIAPSPTAMSDEAGTAVFDCLFNAMLAANDDLRLYTVDLVASPPVIDDETDPSE